jgi:hypothetical protein
VDLRRGPILSAFKQSTPIVNFKPIEGQGPDGLVDTESYDFSNTSFLISGEFTSLTQLTLASFTGADMTPGQAIANSSPAFITLCQYPSDGVLMPGEIRRDATIGKFPDPRSTSPSPGAHTSIRAISTSDVAPRQIWRSPTIPTLP